MALFKKKKKKNVKIVGVRAEVGSKGGEK